MEVVTTFASRLDIYLSRVEVVCSVVCIVLQETLYRSDSSGTRYPVHVVYDNLGKIVLHQCRR